MHQAAPHHLVDRVYAATRLTEKPLIRQLTKLAGIASETMMADAQSYATSRDGRCHLGMEGEMGGMR